MEHFVTADKKARASHASILEEIQDKREWLEERLDILEAAITAEKMVEARQTAREIKEGKYLCQFYDTNWEEDLTIDRERQRHPSADMLVYKSEYLALTMEMLRVKNEPANILGPNATSSFAIEEFWKMLRSDWFTARIQLKDPGVTFMNFDLLSEKFNRDVTKADAMTMERLNAIFLNQASPDWGVFYSLVHELAHLIVLAPYSGHGRLFRYTHLWLWTHLDPIYDTDIAAKLIALYDYHHLKYLPLAWY